MSTLSNYLLLGLRMFTMLWLTRELFLGLSPTDYGFWALLWSIFGYTLLLDFGFGTAVQKWSGQTLADGNWDRLRSLLLTLGLCYAGMGLLIAALSLLGAWLLPHWLTSADVGTYQRVLALFGLGTGLIFPTGMAAELLRGLGKIPLRNGIQAFTLLLQSGLTLLVLRLAPDLIWLTAVTLGCTLLGNLLMLRAALRLLPGGSWRPEPTLVREVAGFSLPAWIITLSNLVIFRSDQIVIGATLGLGAIAGYQIAVRLADLYRQLTTQAHDALGPLAARAYHQGDRNLIRQMLLETNRRVTLLALLLALPLLWLLPELLTLWLGIIDPAVALCARLLLLSMAVQVSLRSTTTQILLMCQRERALMWGAIAEAGLNLGLSLLLAPRLGVLGVALGTLIPNLLLALAFNLPLACRASGLKLSEYLRETLWPPLRGALTALVVSAPLMTLCGQLPLPPLLRLLLSGLICLSISLVALGRLGLTPAERTQLLNFLRRRPVKPIQPTPKAAHVLASGE